MIKAAFYRLSLALLIAALLFMFATITILLVKVANGEILVRQRDYCKITQTAGSTITECTPFFYLEYPKAQ